MSAHARVPVTDLWLTLECDGAADRAAPLLQPDSVTANATTPAPALTFAVTATDASDPSLGNTLLVMLKKPSLAAPLADLVNQRSAAVMQRRPQTACVLAAAFIGAVKLTPSSVLTAAQKATLIADATRIRAVSAVETALAWAGPTAGR